MSFLLNGVRRYRKQIHPHIRHHMNRLVEFQRPKAVFVTCSDSRLDPMRLTAAEPGDLIVIRNSGNIVSPQMDGMVRTIKHAVCSFNVNEIVICGHSHCDATECHQAESTELERSSKNAIANVQLQLNRLRDLPFVREAISTERLKTFGWFYRFESGEVTDVETGYDVLDSTKTESRTRNHDHPSAETFA